MTLPLDRAESVRPGEELDPAALTAYLKAHQGLSAEPTVRQFRQGHSNLTYLVTVEGYDYVLRRPPFGNQVKTAHDMAREYRILKALAPAFPAAPRPLLLCEDPSVIGAPFYLMERRHGTVLRRTLPKGYELTPDAADRLCRAMVDTLAALHQVDYRAIGLEGFGKPEGYVARQVKGWTERYRAAETDSVPAMETAAAWLAASMPPERGATIIHNDFKFDNVMVAVDDPGSVVAVLDWEMATIGDPLMDLGMALAYWIEPGDPEPLRSVAMGPTAAPGMWNRERFVAAYAERTGRDPGDLAFYRAFGSFKLAVIGQQIYARFARGLTTDERFATMNRMVAVLATEAVRIAGA